MTTPRPSTSSIEPPPRETGQAMVEFAAVLLPGLLIVMGIIQFGLNSLGTGAGARCDLQSGPALPIVARRYANPPGPGGGFVDHVATVATSGSGSRRLSS